jgi:hypothetical protein
MNSKNGIPLHGAILGAVAALGLGSLLLTCPPVQAAPPPSPVGSWDCLTSGGGQQGIAFITFADDGTFSGYQLLATTAKGTTIPDLTTDRNPGVDIGRNLELGEDALKSSTNFFGFGEISGPWGYDLRGNVVGHYSTAIDEDAEGAAGSVLSISFSGKVVPGKRLNLVASTSNGKVAYKGVPFREMPDLSGDWIGTKTENKQKYLEFFTLSADPFPNVYWMEGVGPAYEYGIGRCLVSAQKKIGFALLEGGSTNGVLRATLGSLTTKNGYRAATKGSKAPAVGLTFDAFKAP